MFQGYIGAYPQFSGPSPSSSAKQRTASSPPAPSQSPSPPRAASPRRGRATSPKEAGASTSGSAAVRGASSSASAPPPPAGSSTRSAMRRSSDGDLAEGAGIDKEDIHVHFAMATMTSTAPQPPTPVRRLSAPWVQRRAPPTLAMTPQRSVSSPPRSPVLFGFGRPRSVTSPPRSPPALLPSSPLASPPLSGITPVGSPPLLAMRRASVGSPVAPPVAAPRRESDPAPVLPPRKDSSSAPGTPAPVSAPRSVSSPAAPSTPSTPPIDAATAAAVQELTRCSPLQREIDRLSALCDQHELKFRSLRTSFEHRVFSEFPNVLKTFSELDQRADRITADLNIAINKSEPVFHTRIDLLLEDRKADLETLRSRTSPWRAIVQEALEDLASRGLHERIERIKGAGEERNDGDMLTILERYSEHIENELRQQIVLLKAQLAEQRFKRSLRVRFGLAAFVFVVAALFALWLNHWMNRYSQQRRERVAAQ
ncbi:hypothetical protein Q8F55_002517 [Vanrija albida]|uniref:Sensitive to high expression protein 9, mitochondrial n=1 Tax=Vanrija albida TaxID=181172 RepID=A0ABR3QA06_9TREE